MNPKFRMLQAYPVNFLFARRFRQAVSSSIRNSLMVTSGNLPLTFSHVHIIIIMALGEICAYFIISTLLILANDSDHQTGAP